MVKVTIESMALALWGGFSQMIEPKELYRMICSGEFDEDAYSWLIEQEYASEESAGIKSMFVLNHLKYLGRKGELAMA